MDCPKTKSFVVIIVKNIAINLYNSRKRRAVLSLDEMEGWTGGAAPSPQQSVEDQEGALALAALLERMPEGYRSVLLLKYDNGYSTGEIADMLGLTEENVKKRIQRARKKLEELLQAGRDGDAHAERNRKQNDQSGHQHQQADGSNAF